LQIQTAYFVSSTELPVLGMVTWHF